jgi:D-sedoheptulose 7-phosphate isomerase
VSALVEGEPLPTGRAHVAALEHALRALRPQLRRIDELGQDLAGVLERGGRVLVAGNGGSAAQAQHLSSELVGRYRDDRRPLSALCLHADTSSVTAIVNDYGADAVFARQLMAHGRPGDIFVALSTSGRSPNLLEAMATARDVGARGFALTGPAPNPLAALADDVVAVEAIATATVQEVHQVVIHLLCAAVDVSVGASRPLTVEVTP